jgi:hypothetical protein
MQICIHRDLLVSFSRKAAMKTIYCALTAGLISVAFAGGTVLAQSAPPASGAPAAGKMTPAQKKQMTADCNKQVKEQKMKGKEKTAFMKDCMAKGT